MDKTAKIKIEEYTPKGAGRGFFKEKNDSLTPVQIPHTVIGDEVSVSITSKRRGVRKGRVDEILTPSVNRVTPRCKHATMCGGCCWQQVDYQKQLKEKEKVVLNAFSYIDNLNEIFHPIMGCEEEPWYYRNKMEFSFSENRGGTKYVGLMIAAANRYVFNVEECFLGGIWFADLLTSIRAWWDNHSELKAYNYNDGSGHLRAITFREGKHTHQKMVVLTVSGNTTFPEDVLESFVNLLNDYFSASGDETRFSAYLQKVFIEKNKRTQIEKIHLAGLEQIEEEIHLQISKAQEKVSLTFSISPESFFQPNTLQAGRLYSKAIELSEIKEGAVVYDLYCGTGTLGMAFSPFAKKVIGIELNEQAVIDAKNNMSKNKVSNFEVFCGDVGKTIQTLPEDVKKPDLVIVDPPRSGLDTRAISQLLEILPEKIVYISCNPKTQGENVKDLLNHYELTTLQPVDQFYHTFHVENIAILKRKESQ